MILCGGMRSAEMFGTQVASNRQEIDGIAAFKCAFLVV
jgi:hypothetical protein